MILLAAIALLLVGLACNAIGNLANGAEPTATRVVEEEEPTEEPEEEPTEELEEEPTEEIEEEPTEEIEEEPTEEPEEEPTEEVEEFPTLSFEETGDTLFEDDFSDPETGWGEESDEIALREYRDGEYVIEAYDTGWLIRSHPGQDELSNIHVTVTVANVGEAQDASFGVICNFQGDDEFYYLGFDPGGYYAIVRADPDEHVYLTSDESLWHFSEDIELGADSYTLEAICADDGTLVLMVDGIEIASAFDDTYLEGDIGLFVLSFEQIPVEVHFDDLVVVSAE